MQVIPGLKQKAQCSTAMPTRCHLRLVRAEPRKNSVAAFLHTLLASRGMAAMGEILMWVGVPLLYFQLVDLWVLGVPWEFCGKYLIAGGLLTFARPIGWILACGVKPFEKV